MGSKHVSIADAGGTKGLYNHGTMPFRNKLCKLLVTSVLACTAAGAQAKLKVLISVDMEGVAGVVGWKTDAMSSSRDYASARKLMEGETNAAIRGAFDAGATDVLVADAHGDFTNLEPDTVDPRVRLIRGFPRVYGMVEGIARDVDAVVLIGYHAPEGVLHGSMAHTFTGSMTLKLNGAVASEATFNAAICGSFGVPVVFLSGDTAATADIRSAIPGVQTVATKDGIVFNAINSISPELSRKRIHDGVQLALSNRAQVKPYAVSTPVQMEIRYHDISQADLVSMWPQATRDPADAFTVRILAKDMTEASRDLLVADILSAVSHE